MSDGNVISCGVQYGRRVVKSEAREFSERDSVAEAENIDG
jgi:hypothetical protein